MSTKLSITALMAALLTAVIMVQPASAQLEKQRNFLGARIGIGAIGSAFSYSADYEYVKKGGKAG